MFGKAPKIKKRFLGPCVGATTPTSVKLWLHYPLLEGDEPIEVRFTLHEGGAGGSEFASADMKLTPETLGSGTVEFTGLRPNTTYHYRVWKASGEPLAIRHLGPADLHFRTFPAEDRPERLDFLLLTCHDPTQVADDGHEGFGVWAALEQIRKVNDIRFAILAGDQIYGDQVQEQVLAERDERARLKLYLGVYQRLWDHPSYRKALCSMPAYLMWDDHDITDGWGSRSDLFVDATSSEISPEWKDLFGSARKCFEHLQAARNPAPLATGSDAGFDCCFKIGRAGFVMADLRSHRNSRAHRVWSQAQFAAVEDWVARNRGELDSLFFVTPVVFTHGWPHLEKAIRKLSPILGAITQVLARIPVLSRIRPVERLIKRNVEDIAGFRDDLEDAWSSDPNNAEAEQVLDFLFWLQNPDDGSRPLPVILLSGDIHAAGYSMIYSSKPEHRKKPVIEHICSSPVASKPLHWMVEAMYQAETKVVSVGTSGNYCAQVSHHHCQRNVAVLSLRRFGKSELQLKAKYYLEGRPQPEVIISDLNRVSGYEAIRWGHELNEEDGTRTEAA